MDMHLEEAGEYEKPRYTTIKCKNFDLCGNYLTEQEKEACDKEDDGPICTDCFQRQESDERDEKKIQREFDKS